MKPKKNQSSNTNTHSMNWQGKGKSELDEPRRSPRASPSSGASNDKRVAAKSDREEQEEENPNAGFSEYLKSGTGLEMMRMFVVANSLVLFITVAWPSMKQSYQIFLDMLNGVEEAEI